MQLNEYVNTLNEQGINYLKDQPLKNYGTYGTGGIAKIVVFPKNQTQLKSCLTDECAVIGNGSNVLFSDKGYSGALIVTKEVNEIEVRGTTVIAEAGVSLAKLRECCELNCLSGLEFTEGIPATVGGATCMNAGCFSKSLSDVISYVVTNKRIYNNTDCQFAYRSSIFTDNGGKEAILRVCFLLKPSESDVIEAKLEKFKKLRKSSQPHGKSCGSVFLNDGYFAGKLIDQANLKGYKIGGAKVSQKHGNFIINEGGTSSDIYKLIKHIKRVVYEVHGVKLKEELKYIGNFDD